VISSPSVLFRVDAGPGVGLGHLQRCLALAAAFDAQGWHPAFVINDDARAATFVAETAWRQSTTVPESWTDDDARALIAEASRTQASVVVVDSDLESAAYRRRLASAGLFVCTIEDGELSDVAAHVLLNGDADAERLAYPADGTQLLIGPEYALLPPPYWNGDAPPPRVPPTRVLFTLGGSDPLGLMPALLRESLRLPSSLRIDAVAGPFAPHGAALANALAAAGSRVSVHESPRGLFPLIAASDLAVTAAGQTLYQLASLGRPAVAIEVAANQRPQLDEFVSRGAVVDAGPVADSALASRVIDLVAMLASDETRLHSMAAAGRRIVDGRGATRAAAALIAHVERVRLNGVR
jgi:UDP-2,4-diacetamido-2,4,6-trideoxy-beta-L-altropyranose hydrolase